MNLLYEIEKFLHRVNMSPTRFGRLAVRDPRLVGDMRRGREVREDMERRIRAYLAAQQVQQ